MQINPTMLEKSAVTVLSYRDVTTAIDWLCGTLGFKKHLILQEEQGSIRYAQLTLGGGMIMVAPISGTVLDEFLVQPDEVNGAETQSSYFFVADLNAHYVRATSAGAEIIVDKMDHDGARRGYSCRDPEGHIWNFGSFNPWAGDDAKAPRPFGSAFTAAVSTFMSAMLTALTLAVGGLHAVSHQPARIAGWSVSLADGVHRVSAVGLAPTSERLRPRLEVSEALDRACTAQQLVEYASEESRAEIARQQRQTEAAQAAAREALDLLESERRLRMATEREHAEALDRIKEQVRVQSAQRESENEVVILAAREARALLEKERSLRLIAERRVKEANRRTVLAHNARARSAQVSQESSFKFNW